MSPLWKQLTAAILVSITNLIFGTSLGWPSPVIRQITKNGLPMNMTQNEISLMVSIMNFGTIVSPIPAGMLMEAIGRKSTLLYLSSVSIASWTLIYFAKNPIHLYIARFLAGCWIGTSAALGPPYIAEISEARYRGAFSTMLQFMCNFGVLFAFYVGSKVDYYTFSCILGGIPIMFIIFFSFMPESPYWYVKKGRHDKAVQSLVWLRAKKPEEVKHELEEIEATLTERIRKTVTIFDLLRDRGNRKALLIVVFMTLTEYGTGMTSTKAYMSTILPEGGTGSLSVNDSISIIGVVITFVVLVSTFLIDRLGRRPLLLFSSVGAGSSMLVTSAWYFLNSKTTIDVASFSWIPFASLLSYFTFLYLGVGVLGSTVQGELFSTSFRGIASGIAGIVIALTCFVMDLAYMPLAVNVGVYFNYFIFSISAFCSTIIVYFFLIETKGKTLYEIQLQLSKKKSRSIPL